MGVMTGVVAADEREGRTGVDAGTGGGKRGAFHDRSPEFRPRCSSRTCRSIV